VYSTKQVDTAPFHQDQYAGYLFPIEIQAMSFTKYCFAGLFLAANLILNACSDNSTKAVDNSLIFVSCEDIPELDCGVFDVPLIHDSTDSRRLSIDVARLPGIGDGPHEPLIINSGGPGSGIEILRELFQLEVIPNSIRERYDIIGFDQRGVSDPLRLDCDHLSDTEPSLYPRDLGDVQTMVNNTTLLADACFAEYSDSLLYLGSNAVVQDLEIMRILLGAPKLNMIGISFGTRITALYLERYPNASGRVILDAPLRPNGNLNSLLMDTATAQQQSFEQMLSACGTTLPDCERASVEPAFVARVNNLLDTDDRETLEAFFLLLTIAIEETDNGEFLAPLLIDYAFTGDPTDMFALIQEFELDDHDEENENSDENNSITLEKAVLCADDEQKLHCRWLQPVLAGLMPWIQ